MRQIIAIGGGGFGRKITDLKIEKYILNQCSKNNPNICFIPTATGDDQEYIDSFYEAFNSLGCKTSHIDFFKRTINLEDHINHQDIIFVGGGNTKSMLAVWREWGLDKILRTAYRNGVVMSGVSAGAICWFQNGITDSWSSDLKIISCLNFVKGTCCPHYDEEPERKPAVKKFLINRKIKDVYAVDGGVALHIKDEKDFKSVVFRKDKGSYRTFLEKKEIMEKKFRKITLV